MKVVFDKWVNGIALPNGLHQSCLYEISNLFNEEEIRKRVEETVGVSFRWHDNFHRYTIKPGLLKQVSPDEVDINDNETYLFPLEILHFEVLWKGSYTKNTNIHYSLMDTLSTKMRNLILSGKVKIIINLTHDPIMLDGIREIEDYFRSYGMDLKNLIMVAGNIQKNTEMHVIESSTFFAHESAKEMMNFPFVGSLNYTADIVREADLDGSKRSKHFLTLNRANRKHRYYLLYELVRTGLLEKSLASFISPMQEETDIVQNWLYEHYGADMPKDIIDKANAMIPIELDTNHFNDKTGFPSNQTNKQWYTDSYVSIVSETDFINNDYPFNSEKTFRPFVNLHPFIHYGNIGAIQLLHELGFKTFEPYIDEAYTREDNKKKRVQLMMKEIVRLGNMPLDTMHDLYYNCKDILLYNQEHLKTFIDTNPYIELFEKIEDLYR
jgi:hypothetical protein